MPPDGVKWIDHNEILRYEELLRIIGAFISLGVDKVRITGGEPLVRKGLLPFLRKIKMIPGIKEVALTTNGSMLKEYASLLKEAGVDRINVSLDTLQRERFIKLTGQDKLAEVLAGIKKAQEVGFKPIKINMVVMKGFNTDEILEMAALAINNPYQIRFIEYMPFQIGENYLYKADEIVGQLIVAGFPKLIPERSDNSSSRIYHIADSQGSIGFIAPVSQEFCNACNRIRLTPDGYLKPCLLSNDEYCLREELRSGISDQELMERIKQVIRNKPKQHYLGQGQMSERGMSRIGG